MTNRYRMIELIEGEYVQFVGVHALKWRPGWGKPEVGFIEEDYDDPPGTPTLEERNAELVEALRVCRAALGPFIEDDNSHPLPLEAHTRADALLAKEEAAK